MTAVPCRPAIKVESYVPLAQDEVQHWVPGLTTEDKKMITSGMWLSDQIVDAGQKLLKSTYPHIQGLQEAALVGAGGTSTTGNTARALLFDPEKRQVLIECIPQKSFMTTGFEVSPSSDPTASIFLTTSIPSKTFSKIATTLVAQKLLVTRIIEIRAKSKSR
ncbi:hypothetical protein EMCRGX_G008309 [Ephydatia muelleri]